MEILRNPKISVLMSVYNGEKYLSCSIESILNQSYGDFEFLIINDGSIDKTPEILAEYCRKDSRVKAFHQENTGLARSLNRIISLSGGTYLARQDADDISLPRRFEKQVEFLEKNPSVTLVGTNYQIVDNNGDIIGIANPPSVDEEIKNELIRLNCFGHGTVMLRKSCLDTAGMYDENFRFAQDYDLWLRISEKFKVANIEEVLYIWRKHSNSISLGKRHEQDDYARIAVQNSLIRKNRGKHQKEKPKVSVILPTYNRPEMLKNAVSSILGQLYQSFEIIVVNDAGEDVRTIIDEFNDKRIVYLKHDVNRGLAAARNTGIKAANGEYITYLDDDDIFYPAHLSVVSDSIEKNKSKVIFTQAYRAVQVIAVNDRYRTILKDTPYRNGFDKDFMLVENYIPIITVIHHRSCIDDAGGFDENLHVFEDWDFLIRLSRIYDFVSISDYTCEVRHRLDNSNMTFNKWSEFLKTKKDICNKYKHYSSDSSNLHELQIQSISNLKEMADNSMSLVEVLLKEAEFKLRQRDLQITDRDEKIKGLKNFENKVKNSFPYKIYKLIQKMING